MLYLASKVSSASFSWRQRLSVPRPFMMMTREEMPWRYPHEHEVALNNQTQGDETSDPAAATCPPPPR